MSTDRELLELAAKASGYEVVDIKTKDCIAIKTDYCNHKYWNPRIDRGDALSVAVKLNEFEPYKSRGGWKLSSGLNLEEQLYAIVRAAAEIGRNMK